MGLVMVGARGAALAQGLPQIQKPASDYATMQRNTVGLVTGGPQGVYARLGNDLLRLLDDRKGESLRLEVLLGSGSVNNLDDLWNLRGVSLAIVQGDVLAAYAADPGQFQWLRNHVRYVTRLHTEVLHVVSRREIVRQGGPDVCALRGKRVNVGGLGSGPKITVQKVFNDILGLGVTFDPGSTDEAIDQVADGRVDAFAYVVGTPAPLYADERLAKRFFQQDLVWLDVPRSLLENGCDGRGAAGRSDAAVYEAAALTGADYPALLPGGKRVDTIGVPAILASYKFDNLRDARAAATATFVQHFFGIAADPDRGLGRAGGSFDRNWCGVDLSQKVETWQRDDAAADWLAANDRAAKPAATRIDCLAAPGGSPGYCRSKADKVAEFNRQWTASGHTVAMGDPDYMEGFAGWSRRACP